MKFLACPIAQNSRSNTRNSPALVEGKDTISYRQLEEYIVAAQTYLVEAGIKKNSRVAVISRPNIEFIIIYFALLRIGAMTSLLSARMHRGVLLKQCRRLKCRFIITTEQEIKTALPHTVVPFSRQKLKKFSNAISPGSKPFRYELENVSDIMLTSGSTDQPKAVVHTLGNHYFSALGSNQHIKVTRGSQWMVALPTCHVSGLSIIWRVCLAGASVSLVQDQKNLETRIAMHQPTHISLVYAQLHRLLNSKKAIKDLQKMKAILVGGSSVVESLIEKGIRCKLPLYTSYGLTEMSSQVATSKKIRRLADAHKANILRYRDVRVDAQNQIFVKGKTLFKGYYANQRIQHSFDSHGWFKTGDLGILMKGEQLKVFGRSDNLFISGGENVYPEEVERIINRAVQVDRSVVVPVNHEVYGHVSVCFIKPKQAKKITRHSLEKHLSKYLVKFKRPREYYKWPDELRTDGIKINRNTFLEYLKKKKSKLIKLR